MKHQGFGHLQTRLFSQKPLEMYVLGAHGRHICQYIHLKGPQRRLTFWIPKRSMSYKITTSIPHEIP